MSKFLISFFVQFLLLKYSTIIPAFKSSLQVGFQYLTCSTKEKEVPLYRYDILDGGNQQLSIITPFKQDLYKNFNIVIR
jgi:hypothetical protein